MTPPDNPPAASSAADRGAAPPPTGILVLDKPEGSSSMRAVSIVRRRAGRTRTGHAGTLDPLATGVLVLALGRATKSIDRLMNTEKGYRTEIDLSVFTTTDDREGERTPVEVATPPERHAVEAALDEFRGEIMQAPPAFSAIKVGGRRAYKSARQGDLLDLPKRPVVVHELELEAYAWPVVTLRIRSGKGFYVRSLARDLGTALGTGGSCLSIRRTAVGPFTLAEAVRLDDLPETIGAADLIPVDEAIARVEAAYSAGGTSAGAGEGEVSA